MISEKALNRWLTVGFIVFFAGLIAGVTLLRIDDHRKYEDMCKAYCLCDGCDYTFDYYDVRNCDCGGK